ncbi:hypothetical protein ACFS07_28390 [Undibacterium arcticum]
MADATAHMIRQASLERRAEQFTSGIFFNLTNSGKNYLAWLRSSDRGSAITGQFETHETKPYPDNGLPTARQKDLQIRVLMQVNSANVFGLVMPSWEKCIGLLPE